MWSEGNFQFSILSAYGNQNGGSFVHCCCVIQFNIVSIISLGITYLVLYYCIIDELFIFVRFIRNLLETVKFQYWS